MSYNYLAQRRNLKILKRVIISQSAEGYKFEVQLRDNAVEDETVSEVAPSTSINVADYQIDFSKRGRSIKAAKEVKRIFKSRLTTQNRRYANGLCYMPTIFNKLGMDFMKNIDSQLSKIVVFTNQNDQPCEVNIVDISEVIIEKGYLFGTINGVKVELFFKYADQLHSFAGYINGFSEISLGHRKSIYRILDESKASLPTLKQFSDIVVKENIDIKLKKNSNLIVEEIKKANINLDALKNELAQIETEVQFELIPLRVNIAMGKN